LDSNRYTYKSFPRSNPAGGGGATELVAFGRGLKIAETKPPTSNVGRAGSGPNDSGGKGSDIGEGPSDGFGPDDGQGPNGGQGPNDGQDPMAIVGCSFWVVVFEGVEVTGEVWLVDPNAAAGVGTDESLFTTESEFLLLVVVGITGAGQKKVGNSISFSPFPDTDLEVSS
jgi:hypothetical protein